MRTKDCIVSFASKGREPYQVMLLRLIDSALQHWKGDMLVYSPDFDTHEYRGVTIHKGYPKPVGVKSFTHQEMPYQFKTAMIQLALEQGYERIIWLDSSMIIKKDLTPLFDNEEGITFFENLGHPTWKYISDEATRTMGISEAHLMTIPQVWGGAFALDFTKPWANTFFNYLKIFSQNGVFKNGPSKRLGFVSHRHDQAVMSVLADGITTPIPYGHILCPPHDTDGTYGTDPYLVCKGL